MKNLVLLLLLAATSNVAGFGGSGPWANATYYPGNLDGKYQAAVTGQNTSGVLSFAIRDGAAPFVQPEQQQQQQPGAGGPGDPMTLNTSFSLDRSLNYYAVFVNGRAYVGSTAAGINYNSSTVSGTLIGSAPTTITNTTQNITNQLLTNISPVFLTNTTQEVVSQQVTNIFPTTFTNATQEVTTQLVTNTFPIIVTNSTEEVVTQNITNTVPIIITNVTNEVVSQQVVTIITTNEMIEVNDNGFITTTNVTYDLTNTNTVFFTNTIGVPEIIGTNEVVQTILFTNTVPATPVIFTNTTVEAVFFTNTAENLVTFTNTNVETVFFTNTTDTPVVFTNTNTETVFFTNVFQSPALITTGVDGAFQANITGKRGIFTFQGPGQLSSPGPVIDGQQVNPVMNFNVNGIRVSFSSQATFQQLTTAQQGQ